MKQIRFCVITKDLRLILQFLKSTMPHSIYLMDLFSILLLRLTTISFTRKRGGLQSIPIGNLENIVIVIDKSFDIFFFNGTLMIYDSATIDS